MPATTTASATTPQPKVWLITGCSSGLGREIALAALARGDHVIASARSAAKLEDLKQRGAHTIALDVTSPDDVVLKTVTDAVSVYGRVDVLVNNAGYSLIGGVDECSAEEVFDNFNTNVFGIYRMLRVVLPFMRAQQSGAIANIGSLVGRQSFPAISVYSATKFAVAGLTESLRAEVSPLGIDVTCIDLGMFRTSFGDHGVTAKKSIPESGPVIEMTKKHLAAHVGKQPGDPVKGAKVIVDALTKSGVFEGKTLPVRLAVGSDSFGFVSGTLARDEKELKEFTELTSGTDHDDVAK